MITLLVLATVTGLVTGGLVRRTLRRSHRDLGASAAATDATSADPATVATDEDRQRGLPCKVGDVVLLAAGEEAWLAGALLFCERAAHRDVVGEATRTVAALFVAPEGGRDRSVYARSTPEVSLDWMSAIGDGALVLGAEPPSAIEHDGGRFERVRRVPLALSGIGADPPDLGATAVVGEYDGGGGAKLLVVIGSAGTRAWCGRRLERGMYDVLPGTRGRDG